MFSQVRDRSTRRSTRGSTRRLGGEPGVASLGGEGIVASQGGGAGSRRPRILWPWSRSLRLGGPALAVRALSVRSAPIGDTVSLSVSCWQGCLALFRLRSRGRRPSVLCSNRGESLYVSGLRGRCGIWVCCRFGGPGGSGSIGYAGRCLGSATGCFAPSHVGGEAGG